MLQVGRTYGINSLCRFLGVEPPTDQPFPHVNTTLEWQKEFGHEEAKAEVGGAE
jgi:Sulfotransferase domain